MSKSVFIKKFKHVANVIQTIYVNKVRSEYYWLRCTIQIIRRNNNNTYGKVLSHGHVHIILNEFVGQITKAKCHIMDGGYD